MKVLLGMMGEQMGETKDVARYFQEALEINPWVSSIASMLLSIVHRKTTTKKDNARELI